MVRNARFALFALTAASLCSLPVALAQRSSTAGISRPSESGPSSRVGRVGGTNTRPSDAVAGTRSAANAPGASLSFGGFPGSAAAGPLPAAVRPAQTGVYRGARSSGLVRPYPGISIAALERVASFNLALDLGTPLQGWRYYTPPQLKVAPEAPPPPRDEFNAFFGLREQHEPVPLDKSSEFQQVMAAVERESGDRLSARANRARELFRLATSGGGVERFEQLAQAERLAASVRDLDPTAWEPVLLLLHSALEREKMTVAANALVTLLQRRPTIFLEKYDVGALFGDRRVLVQQAQRYIRSTEYNPDSAAAQMLTVYSAWLLSEPTRLRPALARLQQFSQEKTGHPEVVLLIRALEAALAAP